jgi:hypothetical protein
LGQDDFAYLASNDFVASRIRQSPGQLDFCGKTRYELQAMPGTAGASEAAPILGNTGCATLGWGITFAQVSKMQRARGALSLAAMARFSG